MNKVRTLLTLPLRSTSAGRLLKLIALVAGFTGIFVLGILSRTPRVQAGQESDRDQNRSEVEIGLSIAPVPLAMQGKNRELVGLGSYIVNAQSDCNGCHSRGPQTEYLPTGNPYLLRPPNGPFLGKQQINPQTYLGGGRDFGPIAGLTHLYARNLTPDKTGKAEGGRTFKEFLIIMRTGKDLDHLHPNCTGAPDGSCVVKPFNGDLLQVMPWPVHQNMTEHDLRAIYEYLSSIPCIDTVVPGAPVLRNDCP